MSSFIPEHIHIRFQRVFAYIDAHMNDELDLDTLSRVAAYSKFHFHRQFVALFGMSVSRYVLLKRLNRAVYTLAFRGEVPITTIAYDCGYESPEAFSRAFKTNAGQTPSDFRKHPQWQAWTEKYQPVTEIKAKKMPNVEMPNVKDVKIVDFPETRIAVLKHRGAPHLVMNSVRQFIAWRKENALPPKSSATYNICYDDPNHTAPEAYRFDICAATGKDIAPNEYGIEAGHIPAGKCAVLRHIGSDDGIEAAARILYEHWLPNTKHEVRDFPLFLQRVRAFPDVPEHQAVLDIFLPLK
ncbi:MAG: AraC family transcriptional regulator [Robiginitomaculum sp.]|nr:MAG: AraC family transcriptional regulator [Robiginitomaculum sp.]